MIKKSPKIFLLLLALLLVLNLIGCRRRILGPDEIKVPSGEKPGEATSTSTITEPSPTEEIEGLLQEAEAAEAEFNQELKEFDYLDTSEDDLISL